MNKVTVYNNTDGTSQVYHGYTPEQAVIIAYARILDEEAHSRSQEKRLYIQCKHLLQHGKQSVSCGDFCALTNKKE